MSKITNFIELAEQYKQLGALDSTIVSVKRLDTTFSVGAEAKVIEAIQVLEAARELMATDLKICRARLEKH